MKERSGFEPVNQILLGVKPPFNEEGVYLSEQFSRTALLIGDDNIRLLESKRVCIFGIGGVGGFAAEALARSGIGSLDLVDNDEVCLSNLNRQIIALHSTIGRKKTEVMRDRILDINPAARVRIHNCFFLPETADQFDFEDYDYVIDAVDTVTAKIEIIMRCKAKSVPVISSMGAGNKLDATQFKVADIYKTTMCPLAKVMRHELKKRSVTSLKVVYSTEAPEKPIMLNAGSSPASSEPDTPVTGPVRRFIPGSVAWVPSVAGLIIAGEVVKDLTGTGEN